jgi:hypothetical protein
MAGRIKQMIEGIISQRSKGNQAVAQALKAKFVLKGINPDSYSASSTDDQAIIAKLEMLAKELGVKF